MVSIPLESGHIVIQVLEINKVDFLLVSIPLESGHIVIKEEKMSERDFGEGFNPLRIGSYCNLTLGFVIGMAISFNPLRIGSYCNSC